MLFVLVAAFAAALAAEIPVSPNEVHGLAAADLFTNVPAHKRRVTRYLALSAVWRGDQGLDRSRFIQANDYGLNHVHFRSGIIRSRFLGGSAESADLAILGDDQLLIRVDLQSLGWDRPARLARLEELERRGVKFKFKDAAERNRFLDPWEDFARSDPYFKANEFNAKGEFVRGWLDPAVVNRVRKETYSESFIVRADWLLPRLLTEKDRGGFYSELLMLPATEADLYKAFLVPIDAIERADQLRFGGAVATSIVAFRNRGLELLPSPYGAGARYIWRTYDFLKDDVKEKNIYDSLAGTLQHDGREVIGSLPNGLQWYMLFDGKGKQVEVVPQNIALDMRRGTPDRDRSVVNAVKCISCHDLGINKYTDLVGPTIAGKREGVGLFPFTRDVYAADKAEAVAAREASVLDYYRVAVEGGLEREVNRHQESFAEAAKAVNDLPPEDSARAVLSWFDSYVHDLVSLPQAAAEMGLTVEAARGALIRTDTVRASSALRMLAGGQPISRSQWEANFGSAMRALRYPWDGPANVNVKVKVGHN